MFCVVLTLVGAFKNSLAMPIGRGSRGAQKGGPEGVFFDPFLDPIFDHFFDIFMTKIKKYLFNRKISNF
jgi:hypothetical protein